MLFIAAIDEDENEMCILELLEFIGKVLTQKKPTEVTFLQNIDWICRVLDEIILNGQIIECDVKKVLNLVTVLQQNQDAVAPTLKP